MRQTAASVSLLLLLVTTRSACQTTIEPDDTRLVYSGRIDTRNPKQPRLAYPGTGLRFRFNGTGVALSVTSTSDAATLAILIDNAPPRVILVPKGEATFRLAANLPLTSHTAQIVKRTETWQGILTINSLQLEAAGRLPPAQLLAAPPVPARKLLFLGDSITCGAGIDNYPACPIDKRLVSNAYDSFGLLLARRLDADVQLVSYGGRGLVRDYRHRTDVLSLPQFFSLTVPADDEALRAPYQDWAWTPAGIVVMIGTNDFNGQDENPVPHEQFVATYVEFVTTLLARYPNAIVWLTQGPMVTDERLSQYIREAVARLGRPQVHWFASPHFPGSACDAHPQLDQHRILADDLEPILRQGLGW